MSSKISSDDRSGECLMELLFMVNSKVARGRWLCTVSKKWKEKNAVFMLANYLDGWTEKEVEDAINDVKFFVPRGGVSGARQRSNQSRVVHFAQKGGERPPFHSTQKYGWLSLDTHPGSGGVMAGLKEPAYQASLVPVLVTSNRRTLEREYNPSLAADNGGSINFLQNPLVVCC